MLYGLDGGDSFTSQSSIRRYDLAYSRPGRPRRSRKPPSAGKPLEFAGYIAFQSSPWRRLPRRSLRKRASHSPWLRRHLLSQGEGALSTHLRPQISDLRHQISDLRPRTSDHWPFPINDFPINPCRFTINSPSPQIVTFCSTGPSILKNRRGSSKNLQSSLRYDR